MSEDDWTGVNLHKDTAALVDEMSPEWMPRSAFVDGAIWMFYGHLDHRGPGERRLSIFERDAIYQLKTAGLSQTLIADAFGVTQSAVSQVQAAPGEGGSQTIGHREESDA